MVIRLKADSVQRYKKLHAAVWPGVLGTLRACHVRNYTIFLTKLDDGRPYLFCNFEYHGQDFDADMKRMFADPTTQAWWKETEPCQEPIEGRRPGEWWMRMEEVFHLS
jgi:L-rhamnose mutarotase